MVPAGSLAVLAVLLQRCPHQSPALQLALEHVPATLGAFAQVSQPVNLRSLVAATLPRTGMGAMLASCSVGLITLSISLSIVGFGE